MRHTSPRLKIVLVLLATLLIASWASAAPRHGSELPARASGDFAISDFFSGAWNFLGGVWTKVGCNIDPNGRCISPPTSSPLPTKEGCQIDPSGRCLSGSSPTTNPVSYADTGCQIDPGGRCKP